MSTLYKILSELLEKRGITGYRMCSDLGISKNLMTELKTGRKETVNAKTAQKLADYFGVTVGYLLGEEKEKPPVSEDQELADLLERLKNRPECRMLFQLADNATADDVRQAVKIIEALRKED